MLQSASLSRRTRLERRITDTIREKGGRKAVRRGRRTKMATRMRYSKVYRLEENHVESYGILWRIAVEHRWRYCNPDALNRHGDQPNLRLRLMVA